MTGVKSTLTNLDVHLSAKKYNKKNTMQTMYDFAMFSLKQVTFCL